LEGEGQRNLEKDAGTSTTRYTWNICSVGCRTGNLSAWDLQMFSRNFSTYLKIECVLIVWCIEHANWSNS
jgi:hypothetical protein